MDDAGTFSPVTKSKLESVIADNMVVFGRDLPGYNGAFGPVKASFEFASKARPVPQKARFPNYGSQTQLLLNQKAAQMLEKGVLIDPLANDIQPIISNNAFLVKKDSTMSWDQCTVEDV